VGHRVGGRLCEQDGMLLWGNSQLIVENVVPDFLHIVPVCHKTSLNGTCRGHYFTPRQLFVSNKTLFMSHTN
ncbi:hypothetical protein NQD34_016672, partial [Periophthalmus magnuspinnatus]